MKYKNLILGRGGGSSVLYLDLRDGYQVVAFVHGLPAWTGLRQEDSLVRVADSFDDYLNRLTFPTTWWTTTSRPLTQRRKR